MCGFFQENLNIWEERDFKQDKALYYRLDSKINCKLNPYGKKSMVVLTST